MKFLNNHRSRIISIGLVIFLSLGGVFLLKKVGTAKMQNIEGKSNKETSEKGGKTKGNRITPVDIYVTQPLLLEEGVRCVGSLLPFEEVLISSEISGRIEKTAFEDGDLIQKGDLLVKVNDDDLQAQLKRAIFQRDLIREKLDRNRVLLKKDAISREAFDQIETDYNVIEADIQLLKVKIEKTEIRAPFSGVVGFRGVSRGSYLQPGTQITRLVDYSKIRLEFSIPEKYSQLARKGNSVQFSIEGDTRKHSASVYAIDPKVDIQTRSVTIRALYNNQQLQLRPGMFASVLVGERSGNTLQVPTQAIVPEQNGSKVWVVRDGKANSVKVKTGVRSESLIEITSGLTKGDSVVISGVLQLKEGAKVIVN